MEHMNVRRRRVWKRKTLTFVIDRMSVFSTLIYTVWCVKRQTKPIVSIDLVIGGDHGNWSFRASGNINENFTSGRIISRIFSLAHVQCKKENGYIMGNTIMSPIGDSLKNIFSRCFHGLTHEGKRSLEFFPMVVLFHHQGKNQYVVHSGRMFLSLETYLSIPLYL